MLCVQVFAGSRRVVNSRNQHPKAAKEAKIHPNRHQIVGLIAQKTHRKKRQGTISEKSVLL